MLVDQLYGKGPPERLTFTVTVAADAESCEDIKSHAGTLKRVSPEEPV